MQSNRKRKIDCEGEIVGVNKIIKVKPAGSQEDQPSARSGHRAVADDSHMWVSGGYNPMRSQFPLIKEMWRLNLSTLQWELVNCKGHIHSEVASHSIVLDGHQMLVFGGTDFPFGETSSNKFRTFNLLTSTWKEVTCTGNVPEEKYGQAMVIHNQDLIVYGGTTGYVYNTDVHKLNLKTMIWSKITPENKHFEIPPERYRHEIALHKNKVFVIGGGKNDGVNSLNKLHSFDCETNRWSSYTTVADSTQKPGYPAARRCHGCVQIEDEAFISGGYDGVAIMDDIWKINFNTMQWTKIATMPEPVFFHSAAVTPEGCMFIFGGVTKIFPSRRTNSCYRIWLKLPSLQTLCWQYVMNKCPQLLELPHSKLFEMGVSTHLIQRLPPSEGDQKDSDCINLKRDDS